MAETKMNCLQLVKSNLLVILTMIGVALGFGAGFLAREFDPSSDALMWIGMAGELYLRMLKSMIVPLIVSSVITGTASMDPKSNGKVSAVCFLYIIFTNMMPTIIGSVLVIAIKPGEGVADSKSQYNLTTNLETQDIFADLLRNLVPVNLVSATFEQAQTKYSYEKVASNKSGNVSQTTIVSKSVGSAPSSNILGLVIVSAVFGLATSHMQDVGYPFKQFFSSATEIILRILRWLIWSTPVGVLSLIAKTMAGSQNLEDDMRKLGVYFGTVMTGLLICGFIIQPITYFIVCRKNPFVFWFSILQPTMIVFATSSTILTTFSTLAVPSVTGASLITVIILLTALNIPAEAASLLFALEWFLDRFRSVVNYYIQTLGVVITFEKCKSSLTSCEDKLDVDQEQTDAIVSVPDGDIPKNFERTTQEQSHL
ncbi:excitatory amino acid transporter 1-like isoform X3 [Ostrea edulis]|uniref:excitatory amino acid transporter 1-like isoform X3 n=1 Tax=Ostrea edulis TaxID=37623 RepID=UPI0024AFA625|nr:excitatory amino acid transporter 1-like isoform X3 [Ostrea edulis]